MLSVSFRLNSWLDLSLPPRVACCFVCLSSLPHSPLAAGHHRLSPWGLSVAFLGTQRCVGLGWGGHADARSPSGPRGAGRAGQCGAVVRAYVLSVPHPGSCGFKASCNAAPSPSLGKQIRDWNPASLRGKGQDCPGVWAGPAQAGGRACPGKGRNFP